MARGSSNVTHSYLKYTKLQNIYRLKVAGIRVMISHILLRLGMARYGSVWLGMAWYDLAWLGIARYLVTVKRI